MKLAEAERIAWVCMQHQGLDKFGWDFDFDDFKESIGRANWREKKIELSTPFVLQCSNPALIKEATERFIERALAGRKYVAFCPICHRPHYAGKIPYVRYSCGPCSPKAFNEEAVLNYRENEYYK